MATATTQDDNLLIIADDSASDDSSDNIEFSFDFGGDSSENKEKEASVEETPVKETPAKEVSLEVSSETKTEVLVEEVKAEAPTESSDTTPKIDLGMSFDTPSEETQAVVADPSQAEVSEDFSFDLGSTEEVTEEKTSPTVEISQESSVSGDNTSMNDILSGTIAKLAARKEVIATDKASKTQKEEEIKAQIKELQAQVKDLEAEMKALDSESDKITANISGLENMKLDPVKEHNAKRIKK